MRNQESGIIAAAVRGSPDPALAHDRRSPGASSLTPRPSSLPNIEFIIEDNGSGLQGREREHMFDPFYSGREAGRGRGLGLSIAWRLARQLGGDIRFDEIPGGPTRFVQSLPHRAASISARNPVSAPGDMPAAA